MPYNGLINSNAMLRAYARSLCVRCSHRTCCMSHDQRRSVPGLKRAPRLHVEVGWKFCCRAYMELPAQRIRLQFERIRRAVRLYIRGVTWVIFKLDKQQREKVRNTKFDNETRKHRTLFCETVATLVSMRCLSQFVYIQLTGMCNTNAL